MFRNLRLFIILIPSIASAELQISNAWIRNLPPPVPVRAGYMTIYNPQQCAAAVVAITSDAFASVEIHQTIAQDGLTRMEPVAKLRIEPKSTVQLAPGGLHLMMMQPTEPTRPGDVIRITLRLDDGSEQNINMTVKK